MRLMKRWIWQEPDWPNLTYDAEGVAPAIASAHWARGLVEGKAAALGVDRARQVELDATTAEVCATAAIEGEILPVDIVRSSVMRRLGIANDGPRDRSVDGLVEVISDATGAPSSPLDHERLFRWHEALFPVAGLRRHGIFAVGAYRDHPEPMQIVSGPLGRERVHYEAPASRDVPAQMERFLSWFAETAPTRSSPKGGRGGPPMDPFARAALAHLWFESIHPFEDGNGRIGRAIVDMALAQHLQQPGRLYSLSRQLKAAHTEYYDALNRASRGGTDVTAWVQWFAGQSKEAFLATSRVIDHSLQKRSFWERHDKAPLNERQRSVLTRLLDAGDGGFLGGLSADKYVKLTGASKATATRDLSELLRGGQIWSHGQGKATRYYVDVPGWSHGVDVDGNREAAPIPLLQQDQRRERSIADVRAALLRDGYELVELDPSRDLKYFGPVVAKGTMHLAQAIGRRRAVIHEAAALDLQPEVGDRVEITVKRGRGTVVQLDRGDRGLGR
jgi:Fic family protein